MHEIDALEFGHALFKKGAFPTETPTEEAVRYIEHGREMAEFFQALYNNNLTGTYVLSEAERIAAKLEKEGS